MTTKTIFSWFVDWIGGRFCQTTAFPESPLGQGVVSEIDSLYSEIDRLKYENAALRSELARVKEAAGLLGHECERARYLEVLRREAPQIAGEVRRELNSAQASVDANPTAAALVEKARKEKV